MKKRVLSLLFAWALLLPLQGCWWLFLLGGGGQGNGGGYPGESPQDPQEPTTPPPGGRLFYWVKPGYTCLKSGVETRTYKDAIWVGEDGTFVQRGDGCTDAPIASGQASELEIDGDLLGYRDGIYKRGGSAGE